MKTTLNILLSLLILNILTAQETGIEDRELLVEKEYSTEIYDVNPLFDYASILTPNRQNFNFDDSLSRINIFTPDIDISVRPVAFQTISESSGHKGFIKGDKGLLNPIHIQSGYVYSAPNYFNLKAAFIYDDRKDNKIENKNIRNIDANIGMDYYLTHNLKSEVAFNFNRRDFGLFGHPEISFPDGMPSTTGFATVSGQLAIQTFKSQPAKWNFGMQAKLSSWKKNDTNISENNVDLSGKIEFGISDRWGLFFAPSYQTSFSSELQNANNLSSSLRIVYNGDSFYLRSGAKLDYFQKEVKLWPDVDMRWNVNNETVINIRAVSQVQIFGAQATTAINPYLQIEDAKHISFMRNLDADISGVIVKDLKLKVQLGYVNATDDVNFIPDPDDIRTFNFETVDYERIRLTIQAERSFLSDQLSTSLAIQYDKYSESMQILYYRPTLSIIPSLKSNFFNNKLSVGIAALINNPQTIDKIPAAVTSSEWNKNLSGSITYRINDQININFNADNIFDNSYQVWNGYDNFGRNLSGGVLVKF